MKITIKTTQQKVFQIDVEGADTVATLKSKIQESQGHPVASQKIIYSGKILPDDKTVESAGIKEKDFLVLMVSKPKPTPTPAASTSVPVASEPAPPAPAASAPTATAAADAPAAAPAAPFAPPPAAQAPTAANPPLAASAPAGFGDTGSFLSGEALQTTISNMTEMGFPREQVLRALRASFNNPDRAVEYLMNGIPDHLQGEASGAQGAAPGVAPAAPVASAPAAPGAPAAAAQQPSQPQNLFQLAQQQQHATGGAPGGAGAALPGGLDLAALRDTPQIQQLRELMAQNPALIQPLIQQLAQSNPGIAQAIAANPEALYQLLGGEGGEFDDDGEGALPPGAQIVNVTEEERAAIERLEALGFPRQAAIEAYFACDKNEELAANYLFDGGFDE